MARRLILVGLALIVIAAAGCGGGKGVTTTTTPTPAPSSSNKLMQPGDVLHYQVTGTHFDGWTSWPVTGTYSETVLTDGVAPPPYIDIKQQIELSTFKTSGPTWDTTALMWTAKKTNGVFDSVEVKLDLSQQCYVTQDLDGTIWTSGGITSGGMCDEIPMTGVEYTISQPAAGRYELVGAHLAAGARWNADVTQSDATPSFKSTLVVSGYEQITVPAGKFVTDHITGSGKIAGMIGDVDMWWCPEIGAPVQFTVTTTNYIPNFGGFAKPDDGGTGYGARTLKLTFKLLSRTSSGA